jgi:putative redox protein
MARNVSVSSGPLKYAQAVSVGAHAFQADEPVDAGGGDIGPNPQELLMASLGACTNITAQMYAERHQWPLKGVQSVASYVRVPAEKTPGSDATIGMVDRIELEISFAGGLSQEQKQKLLEIVSRCPIHRMLTSSIQVYTRPTMKAQS